MTDTTPTKEWLPDTEQHRERASNNAEPQVSRRFRMDNYRIGARISLALALPMLMALWLSGETIFNAHGISTETEKVARLAAAAQKISGAVHELQKERGMSAGFINSKGTAFAKELPEQRTLTDRAVKTMSGAVATIDAATFGGAVVSRIADSRKALANLQNIRDRIDTAQATVGEMAKYYTSTIGGLLTTVEYLAHVSHDGDVNNAIAAYGALLEAKERAGLERAMATAGFSAGKFAPQLYQNFIGLIAAQDALLSMFLKEATDEQRAFYEKTMKGPVTETVKRMRTIARKSVWGGDTGGISGKDWFAAITAKIDLMKTVEDRVASDLIAMADNTNKSATTTFWLKSGLAAGVLTITVLFAFVVVRGITGPLARLTTATTRLADGDTKSEIDISESRDEVGVLVKAVRIFRVNLIETARLQAEQRAAEQKAAEEEKRRESERFEAERKEAARREQEAAERQERADRIEKMIANFDREVTVALNAVASAASQMQGSAQTVSASAEQTSRQASAVAAASEEASTNVQTVASATEELSSSIEEISRQVSHSNRISQNAIEEARQTNTKVEGLAEAAQKIGDVVNLINDIASQTNLLALNATIEAARAGEAGKGFAVVASEVKSLATQTGKATEEIAAQIAAIQGATNDAVQAIQGIGATITQIGEIATSVASAVEEQGAATGEIATNVQQAAIGTQEVSNNITQVTQAAGDSRAASAQMLDAANSLAEQGEVLRREVDRFLRDVRAA